MGMELMSLLLQKFRTYRKLTFEFSPFISLIIGPNAVGKTNIIEAIYTCAIGKSFRAETESDMVRWGEEIARIVAQITNHKSQFPNKFENSNDKNDETKLELVVTTGMVNGETVPAKKYMVNGVPRRQIDFVNEYVLDDFHYRLIYDKSIISESRLEQYKDEEVAAGSTLVGPQRDDFIVTKSQISNHNDQQGMYRDVSRFGSRGEQRLAVLWLKLAELSYIESIIGERPILLLDDIFSELDEESRNIVLSIIDKQQTIITSTEEEVIQLFNKTKNVKIIKLPIS
ncbi:AAA family ATPase [Patescibacteria group bacterium]|nr:AAA family ATPase [Patescibacteria group bacterium]